MVSSQPGTRRPQGRVSSSARTITPASMKTPTALTTRSVVPPSMLHARGVPRDVEVEEVGAVALEVHALARGVGGEQDAHRVLVGRRR